MSRKKEEIKSIYFLLVKCWQAGDMEATKQRLQALLVEKLKEGGKNLYGTAKE